MIYPDLPERALSIMQPWPWLMLHAGKRIENRAWDTRFRGRFAIHAGKKVDSGAAYDVANLRHPVTGEPSWLGLNHPVLGYQTGGIVGVATLSCVAYYRNRSSGDGLDYDWFVGPVGFVLEDVEEVPFIPCKGALSFFKWRDYLPKE